MIYLDNSATTRPFDAVIEASANAMREAWCNPSALYAPAVQVRNTFEGVRAHLKSMLHAPNGNVIFTSGGTEADNLALTGAANGFRTPGTVMAAAIEHPAVLETAAFLKKRGWKYEKLSVDGFGSVDAEKAAEAFAAADKDAPLIVSVMQVNNETGARQKVEQIGQALKRIRPDAIFHVDGVQGFLRDPIDLTEGKIDLYSLSGHKFHAPHGVGALYVKNGIRISGVQTGGGQEMGVRSGTEDVAAVLGMEEALKMWEKNGDEWRRSLRDMKLRLANELQKLDGVWINGPAPDSADSAPHILNIAFDGVRGQVLLHALEAGQVYVSNGSACASHGSRTSAALQAMGIGGNRALGAIRISLSALNTMEEMDEAAKVIADTVANLRVFKRR